MAGIGALLLVGVVLLIYRRRKADEEFEISMLSIETHSHSVDDGGGSGEDGARGKSNDRETSFLTVYSDSDAVVQADEVDPVAEADVYIAYGRDEQAEEVLLDGIVSKPNRIDIKQKLLSLYHKNNNVEGFERIAEEMYSQKNFLTAEVWQEVSLMGKGIAPKNPLFDVSTSEILAHDKLVDAEEQPDTAAAEKLVKDDTAKKDTKLREDHAVASVDLNDTANLEFVDPVDLETVEDESQAVDFALAEDDASINLINFDDGRSEISELDDVEIDALLGDEEETEIEDAGKAVTAQELVDYDDAEIAIDDDPKPDVRVSADDDGDKPADTSIDDFGKDEDSALGDALEFERIDVPERENEYDYSLNASKEVSDLDVDDDYDASRTQYELAKVFVDLGDEDGARKILDDIIAGAEHDEDVLADANKLLASINR